MSAPHVVIAVCPSRNGPGDNAPDKLIDLLQRRKLRLDHLRMLLLDEADELLDRPSFADGLRYIYQGLHETGWQVGLFSATFTETSRCLARKLTRSEESTVVISSEDSGGGRTSIRPSLQHRYVGVGPRTREGDWENRAAACGDLCELFGAASNIIFVRTRAQLQFLAKYFHADEQGSPFTVQLSRFKASNKTGARVLLATDSCGRGIDVQSVAVVINFELPTQYENGQNCAAAERYTQRAGRAGRFGRCGLVVTLVNDEEEGTASYSNGTSMLEWLRRRTGLEIPFLSSDLESLPGYGQARSPQEVDDVQEARAAEETLVARAETDAVKQLVTPPTQPGGPTRPVLKWAEEEEEAEKEEVETATGEEKGEQEEQSKLLEEALARASAAEAEAREAREGIEKLRAEVQASQDREKALGLKVGEVEADVERLAKQLEMELNRFDDKEEQEGEEGGEAGEQPVEEEPVLIGSVWCGGSRDYGVAEEAEVGEHDLVGSSLPSPPSTPAPTTFSTQLSADSAEWIPVGRGRGSRNSNHSFNGSISTMTSTSEKSPGCVAVGATRMMESVASRP